MKPTPPNKCAKDDRRVRRRGARRRIAWPVVFLVVSWFGPTPLVEGDSIRLKRRALVDVEAPAVRLGDVAELTGPAAQALDETIILEAADFDRVAEREITIGELRNRLARTNANLGPIAFSGDRCVVRMEDLDDVDSSDDAAERDRAGGRGENDLPGVWASSVIDEGTLRGQIARIIAGQVYGRDASTVRLAFSDDEAEALRLPTDLHDFEILPRGTGSSSQLPVHVRVFQGDRFIRSLRIVVGILLKEEVLVATRYIPRGDSIRPGDFERQTMVIEPNPIPPQNADDELVGREARGRISRGQILRRGQALDPIVVRRREEVTLVFRRGSLVVRQRGRALESGRIGDVIRVQPLTYDTELDARIDPEGVLIVVER